MGINPRVHLCPRQVSTHTLHNSPKTFRHHSNASSTNRPDTANPNMQISRSKDGHSPQVETTHRESPAKGDKINCSTQQLGKFNLGSEATGHENNLQRRGG